MPRPPRIDFPDSVYHVTSHGNGRARIFYDDDDRSRFMRQLCDNLETHTIILDAYVLMDNHFHLLARTPRANLSRFMQQLNTSSALYARYKHCKPGHQFEARFKGKLVPRGRRYHACCQPSIEKNPECSFGLAYITDSV